MRNAEARLRRLEAVLQVRQSDVRNLSDAELAALFADAVRAMGPDERASFAETMARFPSAYGSAADPEAVEMLLAGEVEAYLRFVWSWKSSTDAVTHQAPEPHRAIGDHPTLSIQVNADAPRTGARKSGNPR